MVSLLRGDHSLFGIWLWIALTGRSCKLTSMESGLISWLDWTEIIVCLKTEMWFEDANIDEHRGSECKGTPLSTREICSDQTFGSWIPIPSRWLFNVAWQGPGDSVRLLLSHWLQPAFGMAGHLQGKGRICFCWAPILWSSSERADFHQESL